MTLGRGGQGRRNGHDCRPGAGRDPYRVISRFEAAARFNNQSLWLWAPACAGATRPRVDGTTPAAPLSSRPKFPQKAAMPVRLDRNSADFDQRFAAFLAAKREVSADVEKATRAIVDDVAARGDAALLEATKKFDRLDIDAAGLRVSAAEI